MAKELDADLDNLIDASLLGAGTPTGTKFLRDDQVWSSVYYVGATPPADQSLIWLDTSGT